MRILVTGAGGFLGRAAVAALRERGFTVVTTSRSETSDISFDLMSDDAAHLIAAAKPTHVLHTAWTTAHGTFWGDPANSEWVAASLRLLEAAVEGGAGRFVGVGTCAEYRWPCASCDEAITPISPATPYAEAKDAFRRLAESVVARSGAEFAWARIFFAYGPGEPATKLVSSVLGDALAGRDIEIRDPGKRFDFVYVDDVGRGLGQLVASSTVGNFNIGSGTLHSVQDVAEAVAATVAPGLRIRAGEIQSDSAVGANMERARISFGFEPSVCLAEGVARMAEFARQESVTREP